MIRFAPSSHLISLTAALRLTAGGLAAGMLAACSSPAPPPSFPPLTYDYLPPITLRVASVNLVDEYVPSPGAQTLISQDPAPPPLVLSHMLSHRLVASGAPGTATVTIKSASIDQEGASLTGTMDVELDLVSGDGRSTGFAEASATASIPAPDPNGSQADVQTALYGLTSKLMDAINVQLPYQIDHHLADWMVGAGAPPGAGSMGAPIAATPLPSPDQVPTAAAPTPQGVPATGNVNPAVPNYLPGAGPGALVR
jgi:hypothetical protein